MSSRKKIVIASVLKPVDDARNYKKIGKSLDQSGKYEVYIIGYPSENKPQEKKIHFLPLPHFNRISIKRLFSPLLVLKKIIKVKPKIIIANTHEILIVILLNKILFGSKIIYDVQENYYMNIKCTNSFPPIFKQLLATFVRLKERLITPFYDRIILAEKCYKNEMPFLEKPVIIGNKSLFVQNIPVKERKNKDPLILVYTGTIAEEYGIFDAIKYVEKLKERIPNLLFEIIGFCPNLKTRQKLREKVVKKNYIKTIGIKYLVPHNEIIKSIINADFAILPYRINTYYSARIPTRIYECLSLKTPMIIRKNPHWENLFRNYDAFIFTDFQEINPDHPELFNTQNFFNNSGKLKGVWWKEEEAKLIEAVNNL